MINKIWAWMLIVSILYGLCRGRANLVSETIIAASGEAINLCISLTGVICLWSGIMQIIIKTELTRSFADLIRPFIRILFPGIPKDHKSIDAIIMNLCANFFGLGNAATPFGLKSISELQKLNPKKDTASDDMIMFLILNSTCFQLMPSTIIALRQSAGSHNPSVVIIPIWISSLITMTIGIVITKFLSRVASNKEKTKGNKH